MAQILQCQSCSNTRECVLCECSAPFAPVCQMCFLEHIAGQGVHKQNTRPAVSSECYCTNDDSPADHFCLCQCYLCCDCLKDHDPPHDEHCVFPLSLLRVYEMDRTGALLKQGKTIEKLLNKLGIQLDTLKERLIEKTNAAFEEVMRKVEELRMNAIADVSKYATDFEYECFQTLQRLQQMKYNPAWSEFTELELLIVREDQATLTEVMDSVADVIFEQEPVERLSARFVRLKNWNFWFQQASEAEPRFIAAPVSPMQLLTLPKLNPLEVSTTLSREVGNILYLPSNQWFFSTIKACYLLSADLRTTDELGSLNRPRNNAGLIWYRNAVYVFGGGLRGTFMIASECFDLVSRSARLLCQDLPVPFENSSPCRLSDTVYFPPGAQCCDLFSFNIPSETFSMLNLRISSGLFGLVVPCTETELVVIFGSSVYSFPPNAAEVYELSQGNTVMPVSKLAPLRYEGRWYFIADEGEREHGLYALDEKSKEVSKVAALKRELDIFELLNSGHFSF